MIRHIRYASCYVYSPAGIGPLCERSRLLRCLLKLGDPHFIGKYAARVRHQTVADAPLAGFLGPGLVLLPVPGSGPGVGGTTAAERLALALIDQGLGMTVWHGLKRVRAVRKSGTAPPGMRPTVRTHFDSFAVATTAVPSSPVVLIDDVVTKGRTLLAAASRLQEAYPLLDIRAFALVRTMGFAPGVAKLIDPCVGEIRWRAGDAYRSP